jgi:protein-S-isoprenylcysteine O-methyltransferase Ste14
MTRVSVAVVLEVVFVALAFGYRSWVQRRRTGSSGFVLPPRDAPLAERLVAVCFVVAIVLFAVAPAVGVAFEPLDGAGVAVAGAVLAVAGIAVCVAAQFSMGDSWRIGVDVNERTALVTAGIFGVVRNPIFSSMVLAAAGFGLLVPNGWSLTGFVLLLIGLVVQVRHVEEPYLRRTHGPAYDGYTAQAGRFLPGLGLTNGAGRG